MVATLLWLCENLASTASTSASVRESLSSEVLKRVVEGRAADDEEDASLRTQTDALLQQANKTASQSEVAARLDHTLMARDKTKALFNGSEHKTPHVEPRVSTPNEDSDFALASLGVQSLCESVRSGGGLLEFVLVAFGASVVPEMRLVELALADYLGRTGLAFAARDGHVTRQWVDYQLAAQSLALSLQCGTRKAKAGELVRERRRCVCVCGWVSG